jgi:hypothetical protein
MEVISEAEKLIASGWAERRGGGESIKPAPMPPEWKGCKPPPEWDE